MKKIILSVVFSSVLVLVGIVQASTSTLESDCAFMPNGSHVDIADVNASGPSIDMAFAGNDPASNQPRILVKDVGTDTFIRCIDVFDPDWTIDANLKKTDDANGNGYPELVIKASNDTTGEVAVQLVDSYTGLDVSRVVLVAGAGGQPTTQTVTVKIYADTGDGFMGEDIYGSGDWASHHCKTYGRGIDITGNRLIIGIEQYNGPALGSIRRVFIPFDTSVIPANAEIQSAVLAVYPTQIRNDQGSEHWVDLVQGTYGIPVVEEDYDQIGGVNNPQTGLEGRFNFASGNTDVVLNQYNTRKLNQTALSWIVKGGMTKLGLRQGNDILNIPVNDSPAEWGHGSMLFIGSADNTNPDARPYLEITYTTP